MPSSRKRFDLSVPAAILAAAVVGAASVVTWVLLLTLHERPPDPTTLLQLFGATVLGAYIFFMAVCLPVFLLLRALGWVRWWSALGTGVFIGLLFFPARYGDTWMAPAWPCICALASLAFWAVWRRLSREKG